MGDSSEDAGGGNRGGHAESAYGLVLRHADDKAGPQARAPMQHSCQTIIPAGRKQDVLSLAHDSIWGWQRPMAH